MDPLRSRWRCKGYPALPVFPGAGSCKFHMSHLRDDGLAVVTLGDYRRRGHLEPITGHVFYWVTWVVIEKPGEEGGDSPKLLELARATSQSWGVAEVQHYALLEEWEHREVPIDKARPLPEAA